MLLIYYVKLILHFCYFSETSELRRRNIQERKNKTKELVDSIKKKMDDTENRYVPNYIWKYAGIAIGVGSLLYLAYQLNSWYGG